MRLLSASHLSNLLLGVFALRDGTVASLRKFSGCERKSAGQVFGFYSFDAFSESIRSRAGEGSSYFRWGAICGQEVQALLLLGWPQKCSAAGQGGGRECIKKQNRFTVKRLLAGDGL